MQGSRASLQDRPVPGIGPRGRTSRVGEPRDLHTYDAHDLVAAKDRAGSTWMCLSWHFSWYLSWHRAPGAAHSTERMHFSPHLSSASGAPHRPPGSPVGQQAQHQAHPSDGQDPNRHLALLHVDAAVQPAAQQDSGADQWSTHCCQQPSERGLQVCRTADAATHHLPCCATHWPHACTQHAATATHTK